MNHLANFSAGRIALHLLAMAGDRSFRFHAAGICREITPADVSFYRAQPVIVVLSVIGFSLACFRMITGA